MKRVTVLIVIVMLSYSVIYGQEVKEETPPHYLMVMYANNQLYYDCVRPHKTISVGYNPLPFSQGLGLNAWYLREDNISMYGQKPSIIIIQPSGNFLYKSFALKLGINILYRSEGEETGLRGLLPAFEMSYGFMENLYLSFNFKSDMFLGSVNANVHYLLNDNISGIMLGYAYKENWNEDYNGLTYRITYRIFKKFLLRVCGNVDFKFMSQGIQAGIGIIL
ncbi:MAG: hypothetical protein JW794_04795 [Candidatus Cloacimonetes bacterium]|nr:hypothetical protein [Candidatus Cloacimonadota bacterium]